MSKKQKRALTIDSFYGEKVEKSPDPEIMKTIPDEATKVDLSWSPFQKAYLEDCIKNLKRELEEEWGNKLRAVQEGNIALQQRYEKLENKTGQLEKVTNSLENKNSELEKEN